MWRQRTTREKTQRRAIAKQYRNSDGRWIQLTIVSDDQAVRPSYARAGTRRLLERPAFPDDRKPAANASELAAIFDPGFSSPTLARMAQAPAHSRDPPSAASGDMRTCRTIIRQSTNGAVGETHVPERPARSPPDPASFAPETATPGQGPETLASTPTSCWPSWVLWPRTKSIGCARGGVG